MAARAARAAPVAADPLALLDERQRAAATAVNGSGSRVIVSAGPGSGKTRVIVSRTLFLLGQDERAGKHGRIFIVSFSRKAAKEIKDRMGVQHVARGRVVIGTFHSICLQLCRESGIYHRAASKEEVEAILETAMMAIPELRNTPKHIWDSVMNAGRRIISKAKARRMTPQQCETTCEDAATPADEVQRFR